MSWIHSQVKVRLQFKFRLEKQKLELLLRKIQLEHTGPNGQMAPGSILTQLFIAKAKPALPLKSKQLPAGCINAE